MRVRRLIGTALLAAGIAAIGVGPAYAWWGFDQSFDGDADSGSFTLQAGGVTATVTATCNAPSVEVQLWEEHWDGDDEVGDDTVPCDGETYTLTYQHLDNATYHFHFHSGVNASHVSGGISES